MRSAFVPVFRARDVLPTSLTQESMIATGNQLSSVLQRDSVGPLDRGPVRQHLRWDVTPILAVEGGAVDVVADLKFRDVLRTAICHEDRGLTPDAEGACMRAS